MTSRCLNNFEENFNQFDSKRWFYYKKISFIIRKLSRSSNCAWQWLQDVHICAPNQKRTLPQYLTKAVHCILLVAWDITKSNYRKWSRDIDPNRNRCPSQKPNPYPNGCNHNLTDVIKKSRFQPKMKL